MFIYYIVPINIFTYIIIRYISTHNVNDIDSNYNVCCDFLSDLTVTIRTDCIFCQEMQKHRTARSISVGRCNFTYCYICSSLRSIVLK